MQILVTGITGFLGKRVARFLRARGHTVIGLTRQSIALEKVQNELSIPCIAFDILNDTPTCLKPPLAFDAVIHLAWGKLTTYNDPEHIEEYPQKHFDFLQHLASLGVRNFTVSGTSFEYGLTEGELKEDMSCGPTIEYGMGKLLLYKNFSKLCNASQVNLKWLRLFYMYADDQPARTLWGQLLKAHTTGQKEFNMSQGDQVRDYLHADIVAEMIMRCSLQAKVQGIINIGSGKQTKVIDLVQKFIEERNANFILNRGVYPYPKYEPFAFWANTDKMQLLYKYDEKG